jgi:hypothetical protein
MIPFHSGTLYRLSLDYFHGHSRLIGRISCLCLARSGGRLAGAGSSSGTGSMAVLQHTVADVAQLAMGEGGDIGNLGLTQRACGFAPGGALAIFLVGRDVERDEEEEVRADYAHA